MNTMVDKKKGHGGRIPLPLGDRRSPITLFVQEKKIEALGGVVDIKAICEAAVDAAYDRKVNKKPKERLS